MMAVLLGARDRTGNALTGRAGLLDGQDTMN